MEFLFSSLLSSYHFPFPAFVIQTFLEQYNWYLTVQLPFLPFPPPFDPSFAYLFFEFVSLSFLRNLFFPVVFFLK